MKHRHCFFHIPGSDPGIYRPTTRDSQKTGIRLMEPAKKAAEIGSPICLVVFVGPGKFTNHKMCLFFPLEVPDLW